MTTAGEMWRRLSWREQLVLGWGAVIVAGLLVYMLGIDPLLQQMAMLDRLIPQKQKELEQLARLQEEYGRLRGEVDRAVGSQAADFSLSTFVEKTVLEKVGKPHLAGIKPQPESSFERYQELAVEVRLEQVTLGQITAFLSGLEQPTERLRTKRLEIKSRFNEPDLLDAAITVAVYQMKEGQMKEGQLKAGQPNAPAPNPAAEPGQPRPL
ncbi:MAG: type II secretion system protein M [Nitrospirae bacterium]|nr:type II secretion system protein M [Nitrospirota bacterium]